MPNEDSAVNLQLQPPNTTSTDSSATETLASTTSAATANEVGPISNTYKKVTYIIDFLEFGGYYHVLLM